MASTVVQHCCATSVFVHGSLHGSLVYDSSTAACPVGMGNISILSYIVILRAHDNRIVVISQLSSYRLHIISECECECVSVSVSV